MCQAPPPALDQGVREETLVCEEARAIDRLRPDRVCIVASLGILERAGQVGKKRDTGRVVARKQLHRA
jgi:hypothetical protein